MKYNIGYTTGVFDLLHVGHIRFLKQAKSLCNKLIVGICSDNLTLTLKRKIPVYPEQQRLEILMSIKYVNHAFIKNTTDKLSDWGVYNFDVVFHGDKEAINRKHEIDNSKILIPLGVEFVYFDRNYQISTTQTIRKIRNYNISDRT